MSAKNEPMLQIEYLPVKELVPYARNSKKHPDDQIDQIALSIKEFGNCDPIAVWHNEDGEPVIVEGHGRALALKTLGVELAPVLSLDHLTDDERRAYSHVHNQTTLSSGLEISIVEAEMEELPEFGWEAFGFAEMAEGEYGTIDADSIEADAQSDVVVKIDGHNFYVSDDEARDLIDGFREWSRAEGTTFGYIRSLLG